MRVIAGTLKGRRLAAPRGRDTRPTSDRVRESLFMSLGPLAGETVVDLFAGSGALGIEALSRGARHVDFVERDHAAVRVLKDNLATLGVVELATIWPIELPRGLKRIADALADAGLVLLDPPYGGAVARATLAALAACDLRGDVQVVVEHHRKDELPESCGRLVRAREQAYGETCVTTYRGTVEPPARRGDVSEP